MFRETEIFKNHKMRILLCVELVLVIIGVVGLFGSKGVVVGTEEMSRLLGEGVPLPAGVYTARLYYEAEEDNVNAFGVTVGQSFYKTLLCNYVPTYRGANVQECQFYLLDSVEDLRVDVPGDGDSSLRIDSVEIIAGTEGSRIYLFWVIVLSLAVDGICAMALRHRKCPIPISKRIVMAGIPLVSLAASLPVMVDYLLWGTDLTYYLLRIEALTWRISNGELMARIGSWWLGGHGYADSVFCGETFLFLPAMLRIWGFHPGSAYRIFVAAVNLATAWISYMSFYRCFRNRYVGMLGCVLYVLLPYRLDSIYKFAAVGECTAMVFLPLLVWGFYRIYTEDVSRKGYLWNWVVPTAGFSCLIQSDLLTCGIAAVAAIAMCLVLWRKTFRRKTLGVLSLTALVTLAVNAWFLVPWIDFMASGRLWALHGGLQSPARLMGVAGLCGIVVACFLGLRVLHGRWGAMAGAGLLALVCAISVLCGSYRLNDFLLRGDRFIRVYTSQALDRTSVPKTEYLPEGADAGHMAFHAPVLSGGTAMTAYEKVGLRVTAYVESDAGYVEFPMLYYKGYEARVKDTGEKLPVVKGDSADVRVLFPEDFRGEIRLRYTGMWYWHIAEAVSLLACVSLLAAKCIVASREKRMGIGEAYGQD